MPLSLERIGELEAEVKAMKAQGVRFTEQETEMGGRTRKMLFVSPTSACGAMLSLSQRD